MHKDTLETLTLTLGVVGALGRVELNLCRPPPPPFFWFHTVYWKGFPKSTVVLF